MKPTIKEGHSATFLTAVTKDLLRVTPGLPVTRASERTVHGGRDACGWATLPVAAEHEARDPHILGSGSKEFRQEPEMDTTYKVSAAYF